MLCRTLLALLLTLLNLSTSAATPNQLQTGLFKSRTLTDITNNKTIIYTQPKLEKRTFAVHIMDGHYLCAHGPSQGVKYLGIFGLEKSIGLALVTHHAGEPVPYVTVSHIDHMTHPKDTVAEILKKNGHIHGQTTTHAFIIQGNCLPKLEKHVLTLCHCLEDYNIKANFDIGLFSFKDLIVNLETGEAVHPSHFYDHRFSWLFIKRSSYVIHMIYRLLEGCWHRYIPIKEQFDFIKKGIPQNYIRWYK